MPLNGRKPMCLSLLVIIDYHLQSLQEVPFGATVRTLKAAFAFHMCFFSFVSVSMLKYPETTWTLFYRFVQNISDGCPNCGRVRSQVHRKVKVNM